MDKYIEIMRGDGGVKAYVHNGESIESLKHVVRHSPDGFEFGYGGSGPSDLALSICTLFKQEKLYQEFKFKVIAGLKGNGPHVLTFDSIQKTLSELEKEGAV